MRQHLSLIILFLFLQQNSLVAMGDMFIRSRGIHFMLNGSPFYANGFNAYWLMYEAYDPSQRPKISAVFRQAASRGLTVARTWAFSDGGYRPLQYYPGSYNEQMFKQYVNWATSRGQYLTSDDDFFRNSVVKGFYKNHIKTVLNRYNTINGVVYKNDPTIMAWELMNEPRCTSDPSGRTIQAWIMEMASYVKSIDRNHLLEAGLEGFYGQSSAWRTNLNPGFNIGTDFIANNRIPGIDFATVHSYPDQWLSSSNDESQLSFLSNWVDAHIQDAQYILHKPLLITEFGKSWKDPNFSPYQRDRLFNTVYLKIYASAKRGGAAAGGLFWQLLADGMDSFRDGYEIIIDENWPTANVISQQAHKLYQIRKIFSRMKKLEMWKRAQARKAQWLDGNKGMRIGD
ncbi:hypothetical protein DH2020_015564 [Rehmannia glutinosa]|uniref:mannan endo-1,4-beta-mannosidase n=1 Tax=Rehmannia glutinosa TaxID=99300 RepID=A0ABR0WT08_REHGL